MANTPTFLTEIIAKIVEFFRKQFTQEQRQSIRKTINRLAIMNPKEWKKFQDWVGLLNKQPDIVFIGLD